MDGSPRTVMRPSANDNFRPTLIVHADWGSQPTKRWMARATYSGFSYLLEPPEAVGNLENYLQRLMSAAGAGGCVLLGFDFPIGLPYSYAQKAGVTSFLNSVSRFGQGEWRDFFQVAESADQISIHRPFYPHRPGGTSHQQLLDALGFQSIDDLRRSCEKSPPLTRPAAPLFWTLGAQQVGKAALIGWKKVIIPSFNNPSLNTAIWPFSGPISELLQPGRIIITETYPAHYLHQLNLIKPSKRFSKRRQADRTDIAARLMKIADENSIKVHPKLKNQMQVGFGSNKDGEDQFDAVLGLFGMLPYFTKLQPLPEPSNPKITQIEGWILGLAPEQVIV